jgi:hypothetical protein
MLLCTRNEWTSTSLSWAISQRLQSHHNTAFSMRSGSSRTGRTVLQWLSVRNVWGSDNSSDTNFHYNCNCYPGMKHLPLCRSLCVWRRCRVSPGKRNNSISRCGFCEAGASTRRLVLEHDFNVLLEDSRPDVFVTSFLVLTKQKGVYYSSVGIATGYGLD